MISLYSKWFQEDLVNRTVASYAVVGNAETGRLMDKIEAQKILSDQMMEFKKKSRSDLVNLIGDVWAKQIKGKAPN